MPGVEGNLSVKWLRRLKLGDQPFRTREETSKYTDLMPDGLAREFTFRMEAKSVITTPSGGEHLRTPGFREIRGLAWTGQGRITGVEVPTDGGTRWEAATLEGPILPRCLTRFRLPWRREGGPAHLLRRATDETGYVQPSRQTLVAVRGTQSFYHNIAISGWRVAAGGDVSHAVQPSRAPRVPDARASATPPIRRSWPSGTSTCGPTDQACRRATAACARERPCSESAAPPATADAAKVRMPNRDGFTADSRPDVPAPPR